MHPRVTESIVEQAALDWLGGLGYGVLSGLDIAPGETAAERVNYKRVFLFDRLQTRLEDLNPKIPLEGLEKALPATLLPKLLSGELRLPAPDFGKASLPAATGKLAEASP
jgi:hypothetical protein